MKKYIYFIFAAAVVLAAGCQKKVDEAKELESRERVSIDVSYSVAGSAVTELSFSGAAARKVIDVKVNNDNLRWNLVSNRDWCRVLPAEHIGSGEATIEIDANESFDGRDAATLLFTAGEYSGFELSVSQSRSVFLVDRIFSLAPKDGFAYELNVSTEADLDWDYDSDSWLKVDKLGEDIKDGMKNTVLGVTVSRNSSESRLGGIRLSSSDGDDEICVYQFGDDLVYNEDGDIYYPVEVDADISFIAPSFAVRKVNTPKYAKASSVDNGNGTETFKIEFGHNYSDCNEDRTIPVSLILNNKAETEIPLPRIIQGYEPAGSLMTAKGMMLFAQAVAAGGDTSAWEKDGVVCIVEDIDMSDVEGWAGIGTEDHPFQGDFDGKNHTVSGLRAGKPLFNYLKGASVRNLNVHKSCSFSFASGKVAGGIAAVAEGTEFAHCVFGGVIEYSGTDESPLIGGIAGSADASSSFSFCKNAGRITISSGAVASICSVGGILADGPASVTDCEFSGAFECGSGYESVDFGGIMASLGEGARVSGNSYTGSINVECTTKNIAIGGLYGHIKSGSWILDHDSDRSMAGGNITIASFAGNTESRVYVGGFIGLLGESVNLSVKGYSPMTSFVLDKSQYIHQGVYLNCGGILGSCEPDSPGGDLLFEDIANQGIINILIGTSNTIENQVRRGCVGGIAGFVRGTVTFKNCSNLAELGYNEAYCKGSNGHAIILGGIAGMGIGGNMTFTGCVNRGKLTNPQYNNNGAWDKDIPTNFVYGNFMSACSTGGIIGAYNYKQSPESKSVTFENCRNLADIWAYRGYVGGIAGFAQNATFTNCSWRGSSPGDNSNEASFKGGIAGGLASATLSGCSAKVTLVSHRGGSAQDGDAGGIVARVLDGNPVTLEDCAFFGRLGFSSKTEEERRFAGGMVAVAQQNTVVRNCRLGGNVGGSPVTANTAKEKAVGKGNCTVEGITYWDGK